MQAIRKIHFVSSNHFSDIICLQYYRTKLQMKEEKISKNVRELDLGNGCMNVHIRQNSSS